MNLKINVAGLGESQPYNANYSGFSSAVVTIVPEFSFGVLILLGLVMTISILILQKQSFLKI